MQRRLELVARFTRALNSGLVDTTEPVLEILRAVAKEADAERGFLMLYDDAGALRFQAGLARDGRLLGPNDFLYSTTIVEKTLEGGRALLVADLLRAIPYSASTSALELGLRSAVCVPLRATRRRSGADALPAALASVRGVAGVLYLDSRAPGAFVDEDAPFFEIAADCAAVALRAARAAELLRAAQEAPAPSRRSRSVPTIPADLGEPPAHPYEEILTRDAGMRAALKVLDKVIASDANVLVRGESGSGKELIARAVHRYGRRALGPFVTVDCGALPEELALPELFGHEAHAFTGADAARAGLFEQADGGILFLDEVGELSPAVQAALLRALQEGEVRRVGAQEVRRVDVRVVAATHRDVRAMVERGDFRHDLFFRLAALEVTVPPLRERPADIPLLFQRFLEREAAASGRAAPRVEPRALARLSAHGWPGNVRELHNAVRALLVGAQDAITLAEVEDALLRSPRVSVQGGDVEGAAGRAPEEGTLEAVERRLIEERLERFGWNQLRAAETLGIDRRTLYRKIRRYGLHPR